MNTGRFFKLLAILGMLFSLHSSFQNTNLISLLEISNIMLIMPIAISSLLSWAIGTALCLLAEQRNILHQMFLRSLLAPSAQEETFSTNKIKSSTLI